MKFSTLGLDHHGREKDVPDDPPAFESHQRQALRAALAQQVDHVCFLGAFEREPVDGVDAGFIARLFIPDDHHITIIASLTG